MLTEKDDVLRNSEVEEFDDVIIIYIDDSKIEQIILETLRELKDTVPLHSLVTVGTRVAVERLRSMGYSIGEDKVRKIARELVGRDKV